MLNNSPFYHQTLRKIVSCFGTLFNEIQFVRRTTAGVEVERKLVPLSYGPKEKFLARLIQDPTLDREVAIQLPRISFQIVSFDYDGTRHLNTIHKNEHIVNDTTKRTQYNGVPYNIGFELAIMTKNTDDGNQIVEQILPYFTPDFTITYKPIPDMEYIEDMPIILNSINLQDNYDDDWRNRRNVIWVLNFTVKAFFYGPVRSQGVIKKAIVDVHVTSGDGPVTDEQVATTPRHIRFTTEPDPLDALPTDDYGYTETTEYFSDGKVRDPITGTDVDIE